MATASEEIIALCEICGSLLTPEHSRQCTRSRARHSSPETADLRIPCEYCDKSISLNELESHSTKCAEVHRRRVEKQRAGEDDSEQTTQSIPCELCCKQILLKNYEQHLRQCSNAITSEDNWNPNIDRDTLDVINSLIPCEYCNEQVTVLDLPAHTEQCAENERQRIATIVRVTETDPTHNLIPCQYCDKSFPFESIENHQTECQRKLYANNAQPDTFAGASFAGNHAYPGTWDQSTPYNLSRFTLVQNSEEYKFVAEQFNKTLGGNTIVQIERIQNRRWFRQYDAHRDDFIERYGRSTETWLFHGCRGVSAVDAIIKDCFNRSHAVRCAAGQGIYFAADARTSLGYTAADAEGNRHMFMARVLVGQTTGGDQSTRICPNGYDTTGGNGIYVTYHDAQAYGEYLITFR